MNERISVILQEYTMLKSEQGRRFDTIDKMTNYILLIILGIAGAVITLFEKSISETVSLTVIVCLPLFFSPLIFGYLDNELMIFRIGRYIHSILSKEISQEITKGRLLGWDEFNARESMRLFPLIITLFRNLILILPVVTPLLISITTFHERPFWANILIGVDVVILIAIVAVIAYKAVYFVHVVNGFGGKKSR